MARKTPAKVSPQLEAELRDRLEDLLDQRDSVTNKKSRLSKLLGGHVKVLDQSILLVRMQLKGQEFDQLQIPGTESPEPTQDPLLQQVLRVAGLIPEAKPESSFSWREEGENQVADVEGGTYCIEPLDADSYAVFWTPIGKNSKRLGSYASTEAAQEACAQHHLEQAADTLLKNAGSGDLAKGELKGPAAARKKGGPRG